MTHPFDEITVAQLRATGGLKWSHHPGLIGAWVAEMDFGTAPVITEALQRAVARGHHGYLPTATADAMSEATADWLGARYGWDVPPARVRPLPDVIAGLRATIAEFSRPGSPVIVSTPAYMPFLTVPSTLGREVLEVPMRREVDADGHEGRYVHDLDALDAAFEAGGDLLVLCNPHNPVGRVLGRGELEGVAEVVARHGGRVFADEIHAPLVFPGHQHLPYASLDDETARHTVTATSASKAWNLPGLKCAQLVLSNDADAARWDEVGFGYEHGAATLGLVATTAAYTEGGDWLADVLDYLDGSRALLGDLVAEHLPGVGYRQPEGTYLALLDLRASGLGDHPADYFAAHAGAALTDGALCGVAGRGQARYNLATPRPVMVETLRAMGAALTRHRPSVGSTA